MSRWTLALALAVGWTAADPPLARACLNDRELNGQEKKFRESYLFEPPRPRPWVERLRPPDDVLVRVAQVVVFLVVVVTGTALLTARRTPQAAESQHGGSPS